MSKPRRQRTPGWEWALICSIILLAFGLRIYRLDAQSMWSDEGLSLYRALLPLADVFQNTIVVDGVATRDTNPPFYFVWLNLWQHSAGSSVFVLRYVSVLAGVLSVPAIYLLGRIAGGSLVGLGAGLLLAISPFHVWMSQELRNYTLLIFLNLLSVYGLFRYLIKDQRKPTTSGRRWLLLWAVAGLLGVYTHYFGFFVFAYGALSLGLAFVWRRWRPPVWLMAMAVVLAIILLPVLPTALERFRAGQQVDFAFLPPVAVLRQALDAYSVGISASLRQPAWRMWPIAAAAAVGGALLLWRRKWVTVWLLLGYATIPFALLLLLSQINPLYNGPRHVLFGLPPFLLLVAYGIFAWKGRWRPIGWVLGLFLLLSQGQWLWVQYHDPTLAKDDVRGAAEFLNRIATADDLIVLHDTLIQFTFDHYYDGPAPVTAIPPLWQQDEEAAVIALMAAGEDAERVWFLVQPTPRTGFPEENLWRWADKNWPRFADLSYAGLWLRVGLNGYTPSPEVSELPAGATPMAIDIGEDFHLAGLALPQELTADETAWPVLYLSRLDPDPGNYTLSFRFVDEAGSVWQQADGLLWRRFPPVDWPADTVLRYDHALALAAGLPPGNYQLWLRVLDNELQPILLSTGDVDALISQVTVRAGNDPSRLPPYTSQETRLGDATLLGYTLPQNAVLPGHVTPLELFWRVDETPEVDFLVRVEILDEEGGVVATSTAPPSREAYPATAWQPGELLMGKVPLVFSGAVEPGNYLARLTLVDPFEERALGRSITFDESIEVGAWPLVTEFPAIAVELQAGFGDPPLIAFHGYKLISELDSMALTLFWRAISPSIPQNYNVFVHLVNDEGEIVAQADGAPIQGARPTVGWRDGEVLVDHYRLPLPADLPSDSYQLYIGLYDPQSFVRLPIDVDSILQTDDRLLLETWTP